MAIPVLLEIAIGLIFIYLILSLLASEIQEVLSTLLQWRAEHLKRSIELLLAGESSDDLAAAEAFANRLYVNPLVRGLNQEARGPIARTFRRITHWIGQAYRFVTRTRNTFGTQHSGPSYIPAETFATTLLGTLDINALGRRLADSRLRQFLEARLWQPVHRIVADLRGSMADEYLLEEELHYLEAQLEQVWSDFTQRHTTLKATLERLLDRVTEFAELAQQRLPQPDHRVETFLRRIATLRRTLAASDQELQILVKQLEPSLTELVAMLDRGSATYREVVTILRQSQGTSQVLQELEQVVANFDPDTLPPKLRDSLFRLAERAEAKADNLENRLVQFQTEISSWFDRSMERASGVYRRNARGVAFLIGIAIAASLNADTFYIVSRLSKDPTIRASITRSAEQFTPQSAETIAEDLTTVRNTVDQLVADLPLPLGRSEIVLQQQAIDAANWPVPIPRRFFGWLVTGIAISMGSSFWFELLSKVVRVRSTGQAARPAPAPPSDSPHR